MDSVDTFSPYGVRHGDLLEGNREDQDSRHDEGADAGDSGCWDGVECSCGGYGRYSRRLAQGHPLQTGRQGRRIRQSRQSRDLLLHLLHRSNHPRHRDHPRRARGDDADLRVDLFELGISLHVWVLGVVDGNMGSRQNACKVDQVDQVEGAPQSGSQDIRDAPCEAETVRALEEDL